MLESKKNIYVIWSISMWTNKITIYCAVEEEEHAKEALTRVSDHWADKGEQFFMDSTLFFS